jgi:hypothetical protein
MIPICVSDGVSRELGPRGSPASSSSSSSSSACVADSIIIVARSCSSEDDDDEHGIGKEKKREKWREKEVQ